MTSTFETFQTITNETKRIPQSVRLAVASLNETYRTSFIYIRLTAENGRKRRQDDGRSEKDGQIHKAGNAGRVEAVVDVVGLRPPFHGDDRIVGHFAFECVEIEQVMERVNVGLGERHRFQSVHNHG